MKWTNLICRKYNNLFDPKISQFVNSDLFQEETELDNGKKNKQNTVGWPNCRTLKLKIEKNGNPERNSTNGGKKHVKGVR